MPASPAANLPQARPEMWLSTLVVVVSSVVLVVICKTLLSYDGSSATIWFADAVAIAVLYRHGLRDWPLLLLAFFAANTLAGIGIGFDWDAAAEYTLAGVVEVVLAALLLRQFCAREDYFDGLSNWVRFALLSVVIPPLASAAIGSLVLVSRYEGAFSSYFFSWYLADAVGILVLLPIALMFRRDALARVVSGPGLGRLVLTVVLAIAAVLVILEVAPFPFIFVSLPLIWLAIRLPLFETLLAIFAVILTLGIHFTGAPELSALSIFSGDGPQAKMAILTAIVASVIPAYVIAVYTNIERARNAKIVEMESRFRGAMESSPIGILRVSLEGHILKANHSFCNFVQYDESELVDKTVFDLANEESGRASREFVQNFIRGDREPSSLEKRYIRKDGKEVWGRMTCSMARDQDDRPRYLVVQVEDIDWRKNSEVQILETKERLQVTLNSITDAVIATDTDSCITFMNPVAERLLELSLAQLLGQKIEVVCCFSQGRAGDLLEDPVIECLREGRAVFGPEGVVLRGDKGQFSDVRYSVSPLKSESGELLGAVMVVQDISESRQLVRELSHKTSHDDLTNLPNRDAFIQDLERATREVTEQDVQHALAYIDLDRFKVINDSAGHLAGDALLQKLSGHLRGFLRATDCVARLGADEFGVLFRNCSKEQARVRCQQLIRQISGMRFSWGGRNYDVGASAGVTGISPSNNCLADLLSQADVACYSAKRASRGTVMVYEVDSSVAADWHREIFVASSIREALDLRRLKLFAQPIATAGDVAVVHHYEVLVRMENDRGELLSPAAFIPAAERYGLMLQIDRWVVDEVLARSAASIAASGYSFSINISADALGDAEFQMHLITLLEQSPIPNHHIGFEITETAMVNRMDSASHFVANLRKMGCTVALDDFGNGLSSFSYLKAFPVDFIKIDGGFVQQVESNYVDLIIVESIHQVAHRLGSRTIAEFVEDAATAARLRAIGVDLVQGLFVGEPRPLQRVLREQPAELPAGALECSV